MTRELKELQGVGGWLMWFCIVLFFFQPLGFLAEAYKSGDPALVLVDIAMIALNITTGVMIYRTRPAAFSWLKIYLGAYLLLVLLGWAGVYFSEEELAFREKVQPLRTLFFAIVWFWYFKVSKRVLVNFGRNL